MKRLLIIRLVIVAVALLGIPALGSSRLGARVEAQQAPVSITVYITRTGEKYHRDDCRYLRQSKIATTLKEAISRGLGPCSVCKPPR